MQATYWAFASIADALLRMLPVPDLSVWLAGGGGVDQEHERRLDGTSGHHFYWSARTHKAEWALPRALREPGHLSLVRALLLVADEGSEGWALFQFLANHCRARVLFLRDPAHRMPNAFTNSLRGVPEVLASTSQVLLVHKFRRAPYGGGKFWSAAREVLREFLRVAQAQHPLLEWLGESIARDYGEPPSSDCRPLLRRMLDLPMGPIVQMRRWWTEYGAGLTLDKIWHSFLVAMIVWYTALGQDPWKIAQATEEVHQELGAGDDHFEFRSQVLCTLLNSGHQRLLRSRLVIFRRLWSDHKQYTSEAMEPAVHRP